MTTPFKELFMPQPYTNPYKLSLSQIRLILTLKFSKDITESRPLKHVGRKKWGTQDDLRAHKGLPPFAVPFDF